jgi:AraC family transcriptional regulator
LAGAEFHKETFELQPPKHGFIDKQIHALSLWIQRELENGDACTPETINALATVFSTYVLRNHSSLNDRAARVLNGGLPPGSWKRVEDFILANLREDLSLERLASIAHVSPSHFIRAFRKSTGQSPNQFVIAARLAHARHLIASTDTPFSQIAKSAGFANNSHMTALMRRVSGIMPSEIRKRP